MKKINFQPSSLQILYLIISLFLFCLIIYIPTLISGPLHLTEKFIIEEQTIEGALLGILLIVGVLILNLYKREVQKHKELIDRLNIDKLKFQERLIDSTQYIGMVNVQIEEIKSIFTNIDKYPETKEDFKKTLRFFGGRMLGIVNTDWILFRIINSSNQRTISEQFETRQGLTCEYPHVSNRMIIENNPDSPFTSIISSPQNLNVLVCCTMPIVNISNDQRIFIQAIINEVTKLFIILNSFIYNKEHKIIIE